MSGEALAINAEQTIRTTEKHLSESAWKLIPKFHDSEKHITNSGVQWDALTHYNEFWMPWVQSKLLYLNQMRAFDADLVNILVLRVKRGSKKSKSIILPPTVSEQVNDRIKYQQYLTGQEAVTLKSTVSTRKLRNKII